VIEALLSVTLLLVSETTTYVRPHTAEALYAPVTPEMAVSEALQEESVVLPDPDTLVAYNCFLRLRQHIPDLPRSKDIKPNMTNAQEGVAVLLTYHRGTPKEIKHYAYLKKIVEGGYVLDECNYSKGICGERTISRVDPALDGFWNPEVYRASLLRPR
jgi:hypothetical protein